MDRFDLDRLRAIPDPFAKAAEGPVRAPPPRDLAPSWSRAAVRSARAGALAAAVVYQGLWLALFEHRADVAVEPRVALALGLGVPLAAAAIALGGAMRKGRLGLGESARRLAALVAASVAIFVVGTLLKAPPDAEGARFWSHTAACMAITCALASVPIALGVWAFRRSFVAASRWRGACLGTAAGGLSAATMSVLCSTDGVGHVLLGHGIMMVVGAAAGALFGGKIMRA
jgi:hypothetical protein